MFLYVVLSMLGLIVCLFLWKIIMFGRFLLRLKKWRGKMTTKPDIGFSNGGGIRTHGEDGYAEHCPITAVYFDLTGKKIWPSDALSVAYDVGLSPGLAKSIMFGADCRHSTFYRPIMLKVLDLKESD